MVLVLVCAAALAAGGLGFLGWQNTSLVTTGLTCPVEALPGGFAGCRVLHLSDLHNHIFSKGQKRLVEAMERTAPDFVFVTGDSLDRRRSTPENWGPAMDAFRAAVRLAPTYFVAGNHESAMDCYSRFREETEALGAVCLDGRSVELARGGDKLSLVGMPSVKAFPGEGPAREAAFEAALTGLTARGGPVLLLSHHPELLPIYARAGVSMAFCGHAHGGYMRLPLLGGLYAPGQGLLPRYTSGLHRLGGTAMAVSRGLGTSVVPLRVWNRPELLVAVLEKF